MDCSDIVGHISSFMKLEWNPFLFTSREHAKIALAKSWINFTKLGLYLRDHECNDSIQYMIMNSGTDIDTIIDTLISIRNEDLLLRYIDGKTIASATWLKIKMFGISIGSRKLLELATNMNVHFCGSDIKILMNRGMIDIIEWLYKCNIQVFRLIRDNSDYFIEAMLRFNDKRFNDIFTFDLTVEQKRQLKIPSKGHCLKSAIMNGDIDFIVSCDDKDVNEIRAIIIECKGHVTDEMLQYLHKFVDLRYIPKLDTRQILLLLGYKATNEELKMKDISSIIYRLFNKMDLHQYLIDNEKVPWNLLEHAGYITADNINSIIDIRANRMRYDALERYLIDSPYMVGSVGTSNVCSIGTNVTVDVHKASRINGMYKKNADIVNVTYHYGIKYCIRIDKHTKSIVKNDLHELLSKILLKYDLPLDCFPSYIRNMYGSFSDRYTKSTMLSINYLCKKGLLTDASKLSQYITNDNDVHLLVRLGKLGLGEIVITKIYIQSITGKHRKLQMYIELMYPTLISEYKSVPVEVYKLNEDKIKDILHVGNIHKIINFKTMFSTICSLNIDSLTNSFFDYVDKYMTEKELRNVSHNVTIPNYIRNSMYCLDL
ncbi:hypothetical protein D3C87_988120 [compost metagenome]